MIKIEFAKPEEGWLPVTINYGDIEEVFYASDVPLCPIMQLQDILDSAITGIGGEVWWHLEPGGYYLSITPSGEDFKISLEYSSNSMKQDREPIFDFVGSFNSTVVPIWRALRKLQSHNYNEFGLSEKTMNAITIKVKSMQKG